MSIVDRNDACPCGSTKKFKHCCQRKEKAQKAKSHPHAAMLPMWLKLALQHLQAGRLPQAKMLYEKILLAEPNHSDALHMSGLICHQQGNSQNAVNLINQAIRTRPSEPIYFSNLGKVLQSQGRLLDAIASYRQVLVLKPNFADAYNTLGTALKAAGRMDEAIQSYQNALLLNPDFAEAHSNLGNALQARGRLDEAIKSYQQALLINPSFAEASSNLGKIFLDLDLFDKAVESFEQAVLINPNLAAAHGNLGKVLLAQGLVDQAHAAYQRCMALNPSNSLRIKCALMLPPITGTKDEMLASRTEFERNLDHLIEEDMTIVDPHKEDCVTNFYLAFQGLDDKDIQKKVALFYEKACPRLLYVAPHCAERKAVNTKIRIGFLSKFISTHSVSLCFARIVEALAKHEEFEVFLVSSHDHQEKSAKDAYSQFAGMPVHLSEDLVPAREQIAGLELDILVYLDIGMEPLSYFLAFSRLARVQCVLGGHPVTTGIKAVDYFLSSDWAESPDADSHYSEKLVRLTFGAFYFERPVLPTAFKTRKELGLPEAGSIYLCPMTLHKIHPDFDEAMARILQLDIGGHIILFADKTFPSWQVLLERRFDKTIPEEVRSRIIFLPWLWHYPAGVILDPFHFGIGSTAIATCSVGTPFVTKPSAFMRGRIGLLYCKIMDLMECVALDTEEYARRAVAIATDCVLRENIKAKILKNNHMLFENKQAITDVTDFFLEIGESL
jgi:protein O-GlcNAc transferase